MFNFVLYKTHPHRVNILEIIRELREARGGMVQHLAQYVFVLRTVMEFAHKSGHSCIVTDPGGGQGEEVPPTPPPRQVCLLRAPCDGCTVRLVIKSQWLALCLTNVRRVGITSFLIIHTDLD